MKRWNLYSKAESITVSIGGNVHGVIPYLEDKQWIRKTLKSNSCSKYSMIGSHRSSRTRSLMSSSRTRYVMKRPEKISSF